MSKTLRIFALVSFALGLTACASQVPLPSNVAVVSGANGGSYMDRVDFSYRSEQPRTFNQLKLCIAENVSNDAVALRDSAGSFVGPATGHYYETNNRQVIGGGNVFKYVDDSTATLVANGATEATTAPLIKDHVKFEIKASVVDQNIGLVFYNIRRAQESTGTLANKGFEPVGVWPGARAPGVYGMLEATAAKLKNCLQ